MDYPLYKASASWNAFGKAFRERGSEGFIDDSQSRSSLRAVYKASSLALLTADQKNYDTRQYR